MSTGRPVQPTRWLTAQRERAGRYPWLGPLAFLILLVVVIGLRQSNFLTWNSQSDVLNEAIPILILTLGQMCVVLIGGIDLSNAAQASLVALLCAKMLPSLGLLAIPAGLLIGLLIGTINGILAAYGQAPSFLVTLGTLGIAQALALQVSRTSIVVVKNYGAVGWLSSDVVGGLQAGFIVGIAFVVAGTLYLRFVRGARLLHAVGTAELAAVLSGLATRKARIAAFGMSGLMAGVAALYEVSLNHAAGPGLVDTLMFPSITAAVVGGVAITGGVGGPVGALIGALIVAVLQVGTTVAGISSTYQDIIYGAVVVIVVTATTDRRRILSVK